jgi:hypothetical protein
VKPNDGRYITEHEKVTHIKKSVVQERIALEHKITHPYGHGE